MNNEIKRVQEIVDSIAANQIVTQQPNGTIFCGKSWTDIKSDQLQKQLTEFNVQNLNGFVTLTRKSPKPNTAGRLTATLLSIPIAIILQMSFVALTDKSLPYLSSLAATMLIPVTIGTAVGTWKSFTRKASGMEDSE